MTALFHNLLTASFYGSIVILAVLLLRLLLGKAAPKKYLCYLWVLAGFRLLMPFDIQSPLSLQPAIPENTVIQWEQPASMWDPAAPQVLPEVQTPAGQFSGEAAPAVSQGKDGFSPILLLSLLWGLVAAGFLSYNLYSYFALRKKVRGATPVPGGWESEGIETAFILGFVKPQIYIPKGMGEDTRKYILAHERTHLDKADHWVKMIGFLALAIHWFNPLVWIAYFLLCKDIEMACDERVIQFMELPERKEYSTALLNCSSRNVHYAASPVAFGEVNVKNRIHSILNYRSPSFWSGLLSVIAIVFVTVCLLTNPTGSSGNRHAKDFAAASQPPMAENPDWGVTLIAEPISNTGTKLFYSVMLQDPDTPVYKDASYTLEIWNGKSWEALPMKVSAPAYPDDRQKELYSAHPDSFIADTLDWSLIYGALPEGDYRVAVPLTRGDETVPHYAWFHIYANALTGEEAEALETVKTAIEQMKQSYFYTASISESNSQGVMLPSSVIFKALSDGHLDLYTGEYCYSSKDYDVQDARFAAWSDVFFPQGNVYLSFPKGEGKITSQEIAFTASRVNCQGITYQTTYTYLFGEDGTLRGVNTLSRSWAEDGVITQSQRSLSLSYQQVSLRESLPDPKSDTAAAAESPWKITFRVENSNPNSVVPICPVSSTGGNVWMSIDNEVIGVSTYTADGSYWLEKWDNQGNQYDHHWEKLPSKTDSPAWGQQTYRLTKRGISVQADWRDAYGALEPGLYRMGKRFYHGAESIIQYAEFTVLSAGGIHGEGGEEAIQRVQTALNEATSRSCCISKLEQSSNSDFPATESHPNVFWRYGNTWAKECYDSFSNEPYSVVVYPADEAASILSDYSGDLDLDREQLHIYFPAEDSRISDEEISFTTAYFGILKHYTVLFDESGGLRSLKISQNNSAGSQWTTVYTVEDRPESEIQAFVEKAVAAYSEQTP